LKGSGRETRDPHPKYPDQEHEGLAMRGPSVVGIAILAAIIVAFTAAFISSAASEPIEVPPACVQYAKETATPIPERISAKQAAAARMRLAKASLVDERARNCRAALARALRAVK
jgi:hypothetical protein